MGRFGLTKDFEAWVGVILRVYMLPEEDCGATQRVREDALLPIAHEYALLHLCIGSDTRLAGTIAAIIAIAGAKPHPLHLRLLMRRQMLVEQGVVHEYRVF
jgi:hypothetical protein